MVSVMNGEIEQEEDGRWLAEVPEFPGAMAYGVSRQEAIASVEVLVLRAIADRLEHGEDVPQVDHVFTVSAA
jgi:predicted RNase H-like HicB family nuclease